MSEDTTRLDSILAACLEAIEAGGSTVEGCLERYPDDRRDLEPVLRVALRLRQARAARPSAAFRRQAPARLQARLKASSRPPVRKPVTKQASFRSAGRMWFPVGQGRFAMSGVLAAIVLILGAGFGGVVYAADGAGPGDALYGVDRTVEAVRLQLAPSDDATASLYLQFADERLGEAESELESEGDTEGADEALASFNNNIASLQALLDGGTLSPDQAAAVQEATDTLEAARDAAGLGAEVEVEIEGDELQIEVEGEGTAIDAETEGGEPGVESGDEGIEANAEDEGGDSGDEFSNDSGDDSGGDGGEVVGDDGGDNSGDDGGGDSHDGGDGHDDGDSHDDGGDHDGGDD